MLNILKGVILMNIFAPILKWKTGERNGLKLLSDDIKEFITPILEIIDTCDATTIISQLESTFPNSVYFDTIISGDDDRTLLTEIINISNERDIETIPVLYSQDLDEHLATISSLTNRIAIKMPLPENITGPSIQDVITNYLLNQSTNLKFDLILDLGNISNMRSANLQFREVCNTLTFLQNTVDIFNSIIISSTSFPEELSNLEDNSETSFARYEIIIFSKLLQNVSLEFIKEKLVFSDYGVTKYTETDIDFSYMSSPIINKIRYTTFDSYIVYKGQNKNLKNPIAIKYPSLAKKLVDSDHYLGKDFSNGDLEIFNRANGIQGPGNGTNWVSISVNHHITVLMEQLSKLIEVSIAP